MDIFNSYGMKKIINARGKYTPLGVSRSSKFVADASAESLQHFFDMKELQDHASRIVAKHCGANSATIVNCASAGITLSIAATMTGTNSKKISQLPQTDDTNNQIAIACGHLINYGHPIEQDIRLAGATPVICGRNDNCSLEELVEGLNQPDIAALLMVESRLTRGRSPDLNEAIAAAHERKIPVIIDAAAQDMRMQELVESGAEIVIFSAQKYLAAPTAGIIVGNHELIQAVRAQEKGIGRAMKASKEAIIGTIAAINERSDQDLQQWSKQKYAQAKAFALAISNIENCSAELEKDPSKGQFWRVNLNVNDHPSKGGAKQLSSYLRENDQPIHCNHSRANEGILNFEVLELTADERQQIIDRIEKFFNQPRNTRS